MSTLPAECATGHRRGFMLVLSSPSGAGKTTLSRRLLGNHPGLSLSISVTTRHARPNEINGQDYHFVDDEQFETLLQQRALLEHATVFNHRYGTPAGQVYDALDRGIDVLFDIDWQGTRQLAEAHREDLVSIFILPPSMQELERRLHQRGQDSPEVIATRMAQAKEEISHWQEYDYVLVNDALEMALARIIHIVEAERAKRLRQHDLAAFIHTLCQR